MVSFWVIWFSVGFYYLAKSSTISGIAMISVSVILYTQLETQKMIAYGKTNIRLYLH